MIYPNIKLSNQKHLEINFYPPTQSNPILIDDFTLRVLHSSICHVKKKDPKKELQKEAWLERKEKALPTYSISCDSIYISHSVKDMIVPTFVRSGIFPSLFNLLLWHSLATLLTFL